MVTGSYVIRHHRPYRCVVAILLAVVLSAVASWYFATQSSQQQHEQLSLLQTEHDRLFTENRELTDYNLNLASELNDKNQLLAIQQAADQQLQSDMQVLQDQLMDLNKELLFYQNITQGNASSELQVRELHLRSNETNPAIFHYRIVITQGQKITKAIKGNVRLILNTGDNASLSPRLLSEHQLNVRHVQVLEGTIKLADNEQPASLLVQLQQGKKTLTERTFEWIIEPNTQP